MKSTPSAISRSFLRNILRPEAVFAVLAIFLGFGVVFLLPVGAGFDETAHLTRAIEISTRQLLPNRTLKHTPLVPLVISEVSYRGKVFNTPVEPDFFERYKNRKIDWDIVFPKTTYSVYFPLLYFPQAAIVLLARRLDWSVLALYYACRMAEVLGYVILGFLAVRLIPFGKWILALLALSPVALLQSGTISTDPYSNGVGFLFLAWVLHLAVTDAKITLRQVVLTLIMVFLLFAVKINASALAVLLFLLPRKRFPNARVYFLFIAVTAAMFLVILIGWNAYVSLDFRTDRPDRGVWMQVSGILADPLGFAGFFIGDFFRHAHEFIPQWIAVNPNFIGVVPPLVYPLYAACLLSAWASDPAAVAVSTRIRIWLIASGALGYVFAALFLYLGGRGPGDDIAVTGRYLVTAAPPVLLGLTLGKPIPLLRRVSAGWFTVAGALGGASIFLAGLYLTFYVLCGSSYYVPGLCYLPDYRNLDPTLAFTPPVTTANPVAQEFLAECASIHSIMIWPNPPASPDGARTTYALLDSNGTVLFETTLPNREIRFGDWYEIPIRPVENAAGQRLAIHITSDNPNATTALTFSISPVHEYEAGTLRVGTQEIDSDLYFHYGCKIR